MPTQNIIISYGALHYFSKLKVKINPVVEFRLASPRLTWLRENSFLKENFVEISLRGQAIKKRATHLADGGLGVLQFCRFHPPAATDLTGLIGLKGWNTSCCYCSRVLNADSWQAAKHGYRT
jgi:hypothetical protein